MNELNSGSISNLAVGDTLLTQIRKVSGKKFSLEFAEQILRPNTRFNFLGEFNASDPRFNQSGPRRAWLNAEASDIQRLLGIDVATLNFSKDAKERIIAPLNILNPIAKGMAMKIQIVESVVPTANQLENAEKAVKQITNKQGKTVYFKKEGKFIYASSFVVGGTFEHKFLEHDELVENVDFSAMKAIAESLKTVGQEELSSSTEVKAEAVAEEKK